MRDRNKVNFYARQYWKIPANRERKRLSTQRYRAKNRDRVREWSRQSRNRHAKSRRLLSLEWYYANRSRALLNHQKWSKANSSKVKAYSRLRRLLNPNVAIGDRLRSRIKDALRSQGTRKCFKTETLIGCTVAFLREWIEARWVTGMSWRNHTNKGWHIDHVVPCSSFDLSDPVQQLKCFHYTNLQPLWWHENIAKGSTVLQQTN